MNFTDYCVHLCSTTSAAAAAPAISLTDALLLLVFAGLLLVAYHLHRIGRQLATLAQRPAITEPSAPVVAPVALVSVPAVAEVGPPPEVQAVIAAAVYLLLGDSARVVAITEGAATSQVWSLEGRRQIFASHQVR